MARQNPVMPVPGELGAPANADDPQRRMCHLGTVERALGYALVFVMPLVSFPMPGLTTTAVAPLSAPVALLVCMVALATRSRRVSVPVWLTALWLTLTAALVASYLPALVAANDGAIGSERLLRTWLPFVGATATVLAFAVLTRSPTFGPERLLRALFTSAVVYAAVTAMALATARGVPGVTETYAAIRDAVTTSGREPIGGMRRVAALTFEPSFAGFEYVAWWLPMMISATLVRHGDARRRAPWLLGIFFLGALGTLSLTAALGLGALSVITYAVIVRRSKRPVMRAVAFVVVPLLLTTVFMLPQTTSITARVTSEAQRIATGDFSRSGPEDASVAVRAALLHTGLRIAIAYPITGAGFGIAGFEYDRFRPEWTTVSRHMAEFDRYVQDPGGRVYPTPKNLFARLPSEAGALALLSFCTVVTVALRRAARLMGGVRASPTVETLAAAATLGIVGSMMGFMSLDSFGIPFLWAWLGITAALRAQ